MYTALETTTLRRRVCHGSACAQGLNCYRRWLEFTSKVLSFMSVLYSECTRQTLHICYLLLTPTARHVILNEMMLSDGKHKNRSSQ